MSIYCVTFSAYLVPSVPYSIPKKFIDIKPKFDKIINGNC